MSIISSSYYSRNRSEPNWYDLIDHINPQMMPFTALKNMLHKLSYYNKKFYFYMLTYDVTLSLL